MKDHSKILFITALFLLSFYSYSPNLMAGSKASWDTFKKNSTIMGFTLGTDTIEDIIQKMGGALNRPVDKHELAKVCFKIYKKPHYIVFSTGVLHDYSTLYGFQVTTDIVDSLKDGCEPYKLVGNEDLITDGGLHIGQTKDEVLKQIGNPSKKTSQKWIWNYENYLSYDKPKISTSEAGPFGSRYLMKFISKGAYEDGLISIKFENERVAEFAIHYYAESDFKIEHYDLDTGQRIR